MTQQYHPFPISLSTQERELTPSKQKKDELGNLIPTPGHWPVDPQEDVDVSEERIWIDGCFDFAHHGTPLGHV